MRAADLRVSMQGAQLGYMPLATNNAELVRGDVLGARCLFCLQRPTIDGSTPLCDESTVICPLCFVDAVVPESFVQSLAQLQSWRVEGFGVEVPCEEAPAEPPAVRPVRRRGDPEVPPWHSVAGISWDATGFLFFDVDSVAEGERRLASYAEKQNDERHRRRCLSSATARSIASGQQQSLLSRGLGSFVAGTQSVDRVGFALRADLLPALLKESYPLTEHAGQARTQVPLASNLRTLVDEWCEEGRPRLAQALGDLEGTSVSKGETAGEVAEERRQRNLQSWSEVLSLTAALATEARARLAHYESLLQRLEVAAQFDNAAWRRLNADEARRVEVSRAE